MVTMTAEQFLRFFIGTQEILNNSAFRECLHQAVPRREQQRLRAAIAKVESERAA